MNATYTIPEQNIEELTARIAKLNKRAAKLGASAISLTSEFSHTEEFYASERDRKFGIKSVRNWLTVSVTGEAPRYEGWTFAATLKHTDEGNILGTMPGMDKLPVEFRTVDPWCAHCEVQRRRNDTYVLLSDEGEYKQVGRQCLKDFLGHKDPHALARFAEYLSAFETEVRELGEGGGYLTPEWSLESFLTVTAMMIRLFGWTSRTAAKDAPLGVVATASNVLTYLRPASPADHEFVQHCGKPTDEDRATAEATVEWIESEIAPNEENASDYEYNLLVVARAGKVTLGTTGLAASMVSGYHRHVQKEIERKARDENAGPVPTGRVEIEGVVSKTDVRYSQYGEKVVMTVVGDEGWAVWGTVPRALSGVQVGDRVRFTATVEPSDKETFGFYRRPSKADFVEAQ